VEISGHRDDSGFSGPQVRLGSALRALGGILPLPMNTGPIDCAIPDKTALASPRSRREWFCELRFLGIVYVATVFVASLTIAACGPGCCFVFYSIIAGVSGILMLRQFFLSRSICLIILLLSLFGMWHEKEVRDTWGQRALRLQIQKLQQEPERLQNK